MSDGHLNLPEKIHGRDIRMSPEEQAKHDNDIYCKWVNENYADEFREIYKHMGVIGTLKTLEQ